MSLKHFEIFEEIAVSIALDNNRNLNELEKRGRKILADYKEKGFVKTMPLDALTTDAYAYLPLVRWLLRDSCSLKRVKSPVEEMKDSGWMADSSFCFVNVRACGVKPGVTGNLIDAMKLLPTLRTTSIHLAPFFECALQNVYGVDSVTTLNEDIVHKEFLARGMSAGDQMKLFVDVAHLLGKTVGFDLEPHASQYARTVIEHPSLFRWIKLKSGANRKLAWNMTQSQMLEPSVQEQIYGEVAAIRDKILSRRGLASLEEAGKEPAAKRAHREIIGEMIRAGLWTVPSHTWKGAGLPEYSHYVRGKDCEYPEFKYLSTDGEDHREHAFGTLTPFRFYDGLPINHVPAKDNPPEPNEITIRFFTKIFPALYERFRFDYIRFDYVDHVFDSVTGRKGKDPVSDRPTPYVLEKAISEGRKHGRDYVGAMAERMGTDIGDYSSIGFDLVLGTDVLAPIDNSLAVNAVGLCRKLDEFNSERGRKVSVQFAVDSHDTGHPLFNCTPMLKYGAKGVALRLVVARFCGAGKGMRPKYEVIGNQDGTTGLYHANINAVPVEWKSDETMFGYYHAVEDTFVSLQSRIRKGRTADLVEFDDHTVYWRIEGKNYRIIPVVNTSTELPAKNVLLDTLDPSQTAFVIDPYTGTQTAVHRRLTLKELAPLEARIFVVENGETQK